MTSNASPDGSYDAVVIGSGQAGTPLSAALAAAGWRTALIERAHVGGTCVNVGCTPTKTMVASARVAYLSRRSADYGVHAGAVRLDQPEVRRRKQAVVERFRDGSLKRLEGTPNLDLLSGDARFDGPRSVEVRLTAGGTRRLKGAKFFINTGCRPSRLAVEGAGAIDVLDSSSIMELGTTPEHLIVLGGGYIGLEFGQMFRRFGSRVTVVQRGARLLSREDPDVADAVASLLREDGLEIHLETSAARVERSAGGGVRATLRGPSGELRLEGSHLLAAAGRVPNTEGLNLAAAGVAVDAIGFVKADERLETSAPGIYALGDVKGGPAFTHISYDDFRILRSNLLEGGRAVTTGRLVPYTVYIDPQLGRVGLTESEARAQGRKIRVARMPMAWVARAIEMDETRGFMKAIVDAETGLILGCAVLGVEGGEIMSQLQIAMMGKVPYPVMKEAIFAHPTLAESLNNLFLHFDA
jgi:pyruvate/2-oxoglutarate dehydrogenase complex dihydrolipoamide dehydrogenase (E3) component